jgi:hypothetical protein
MKRISLIATLLLTATAYASERFDQFFVLRPASKSAHSEIDREAALATLDAYLKRHGFRSQVVHRKTLSGYVAALRWMKPGTGVFCTFTHTDGSLAIACRCAATDRLSAYVKIRDGLLRSVDYTVTEPASL